MTRSKIISDMAKAIYEVVDSECDFNADIMAEKALNASGLLERVEQLESNSKGWRDLYEQSSFNKCQAILGLEAEAHRATLAAYVLAVYAIALTIWVVVL